MKEEIKKKKKAPLPEKVGMEPQGLLEAIPGSVYQLKITPEGKITFTFVSRRLREAVGLSQEDFGGNPRRMLDFIAPEDREKIPKAIQSATATLLPFELEFRILTPAGVRFVHNRYSPYREADGSTLITCISTDITDRKQAIKALQESEEKYRVLIENANEAIFVVQEGRFKFGNAKAIKFTGYPLKDLISTSFMQFIHPDDRAMVIDRHLRRLRGDTLPHVYSFRFIDREGQVRWVEINAVLIAWEGKPATLNFITDITERKRAEEGLHGLALELENRVRQRTVQLEREILDRQGAEEALRESEQRYHMLYEFAGEANFTFTPDLKLMDINHLAESIVGRDRNELIGKELFSLGLLHPEDLGKAQEDVRRLLAGEGPITDQFRLYIKGGHYSVFEITGAPLKKGGRVIAVTCICRDITERKNSEERIRKAQAMLGTAFDGVSDPMIMLDKEFRVQMVNKAARNYYRIAPAREIIGAPCYRVFKRRARFCENCRVREPLARREPFQFEITSARSTGRIEQFKVFPVLEEGGAEFVIITVTDITEARAMERQMMQTEKLASLGLLISGIAHEIKNPNTFISFNIPILRDYFGELMPIIDIYAEGRPDYQLFGMPYAEFRKDLFNLLDNVEHGARRIESVASSLNEFGAGKEKLEQRWADLKTIVDRSVTLCRGQVGKKVKSLDVRLPPEPFPVFTDPEALEQVLINLIINAAQSADKEDSWVRLEVRRGGTWREGLILEVRDNGCGMNAMVKKRIFTPFFTTKTPGVGTGMGLYISQTLVEGLGGRIEAESEPGAGSLFRVVLPQEERRREQRVLGLVQS